MTKNELIKMLKAYPGYPKKIEQLKAEQELYRLDYIPQEKQYDDMPKGGVPQNNLDNIIDDKITPLQNKIVYIEKQIKYVDHSIELLDEKQRRLIEIKYFDKQPWSAVSVELNYEYTQCKRVEKEALEIMLKTEL